ncbi:MAG: TetR/AcrR family transcriptional regulator [Candidatus Tectomicrobia bacterium]|uniref:TetR/AcrR family transcriptional regulator n=1 Tax=Tectimicrobiota bacterium TaxID=2528274 RepID=A0A932GNL1_UNCTE|nr:TetR/AcrR family transcriptional regulator [Candidatus Tectomicrobia bacterium]
MEYQGRLQEVLRQAAALFSEKGYPSASIRDLSRVSGRSMAGLYYYFAGKEELLYRICAQSLQEILEELDRSLPQIAPPQEKLRYLVAVHLDYFLNHRDEMRVLSQDSEFLQGEHKEKLAEQQKGYYLLCQQVLREVWEEAGSGQEISREELRLSTLALFGMINWVYKWYEPGKDLSSRDLADWMTRFFLEGYLGSPATSPFPEQSLRGIDSRME